LVGTEPGGTVWCGSEAAAGEAGGRAQGRQHRLCVARRLPWVVPV